MTYEDIFKGNKIISRDGKSVGIFTGANRPCNLEGCRGRCHTVKWDNGKTTYPCGKGLQWNAKQKMWSFID
jgi:hypothetical protein